MKLIETEWETYRRRAVPDNAPALRLREIKRAFYAGARALYSLILRHVDPLGFMGPRMPDVLFMRQLDIELTEFEDRVRNGWA